MEHNSGRTGRLTSGVDYLIAEAGEADIDELVDVMAAATEYDIVYRFFFSHKREECVAQIHAAYRDQCRWMMSELGRKKSWSFFVKAVATDSTKILGWGLVRSAEAVDALDAADTEEPPLKPDSDPLLESCLQFYQKKLDREYRHTMDGHGRHFVWQALYILPAYQHRQIGTALVKWAFEAYELEQLPVYLQTANAVVPFYLSLGWSDIGVTEVDLAHWADEKMGYGVHRTVHMLRGPRPAG